MTGPRSPSGRFPAEYRIWKDMRRRCYSKTRKDYVRYGAKGITICDRWRNSFAAFLEDMGPRPSPTHSVDRFPDRNGPYAPENCRWATTTEQSRNRDFTVRLTWNGETRTVYEWGEKLAIPGKVIWQRINTYKWSVERALTTPVDGAKSARYADAPVLHDPALQEQVRQRLANGESVRSIAPLFDVPYRTMQRLIKILRGY